MAGRMLSMQGIESAKAWYDAVGAPMLERDFGDVVHRIAVGIAGRGSECFGFDDPVSRDHDFSTGFSLWITEEDERSFGFRLERAYARLLKENPPDASKSQESALGESEHGVCLISDFYRRHIGIPGAPQSWQDWLYTPEYSFAEATNGAVFRDDAGIFSGIRNTILTKMPEDVRRKKIAARAISMAQSGQYNFSRCLKHGECGASAIALSEFVRSAVSMIFLLNHRFAPYYKWMFRAMRTLPKLSDMTDPLEFLLTENAPRDLKSTMIDEICGRIVAELTEQNLTDRTDVYLEPHAFEIMSRIRDHEIRELHVMEG